MEEVGKDSMILINKLAVNLERMDDRCRRTRETSRLSLVSCATLSRFKWMEMSDEGV
jgi:hypothetical protein